MKVGLDIDGVIADFISPFLKVVENRSANGPIHVDSITDLTFKNHPALTEEIISKCINEVSDDPGFWCDLPPLLSSDDWQTLDELSEQSRLVFLTHRYVRESYDIHRVTCDWLVRHGIRKPVVYFTQDRKSALVEKLDVRLFVDDRHENCQDVAENTEAVVLMPHRSYNAGFSHPGVRRIRNITELFDYLSKIQGNVEKTSR